MLSLSSAGVGQCVDAEPYPWYASKIQSVAFWASILHLFINYFLCTSDIYTVSNIILDITLSLRLRRSFN